MPATEHFFHNQKKLHTVFAVSCFVLLVSVIWMMAADQADEWRGVQRTNFKLEAAVKARDIKALQTSDFEARRAELENELEQIEQELEPHQELRSRLIDERDTASRKLEALKLALKSQNADRDEARANLDLAIRDELDADIKSELKAAFDQEQAAADQIQLNVEMAEAELKNIGNPKDGIDASEVAALTALQDLESRLKTNKADTEKLMLDINLVEAALDDLQPEGAFKSMKRSVMELPIIDGFNSHIKVVQDWLPALHQTLGMTEIARFDRCRTCHLNINKTAPGNLPAYPPGHPSDPEDVNVWVAENKFPQPFSTHPQHELFATASSPHPVATFGCTICHDGQGSGTSFGNAEHGHNDPHQQEEWEHEYGYHPNHFWEYPMQPERFNESTCIKCHHDVTELGVHPKFGASAPKVHQGFELIQKYGCFGCHEIHGYDGGDPIGPDLRLEPQTKEDQQRIDEDPKQFAGKMRKVGPSLRHIASKASADWIAYWTEEPGRYRPTTKMPRFFGLTNQQGEQAKEYEQVELAGIAKVLINNSQDFDLASPASDYVPDVVRGKQLFSERGCLACHQHSAVPGTTAEFGPNISDIHRKVNRNADNPAFSDWLYSWIKDPERYHSRTRMPNLYLDAYPDGESIVDPAADIVAFLLSQGEPEVFPVVEPSTAALDELVKLFLKKARFSDAAVNQILSSRKFPIKKSEVAGDEKVFATDDGMPVADESQWHERKLEYIGRRTISRYGCFGCHDIAGYESERPIAAALHDWGRKDTSKLAAEHIEEFLHHHGEPADSPFSSTAERVETALQKAEGGGAETGEFASAEEEERELSAAYFYDSLLHHGRPGFLWQKLRAPRSYDFEKTETKGYDEYLRMPKFPLKEDEIEAIATFVLGLVAEPPSSEYIYQPDVREKNRIEGEFLLAKYNCTGCHIIDLPKVTFGVDIEEDVYATQITPLDHQKGIDLLLQLRKPRQALTGETRTFEVDGEKVELPLASFHGMQMVESDPEEDPEYREGGYDTWETLDFGEGEDAKRVLPSSRVTVLDSKLVSYEPARGGAFAEWLVSDLMKTRTGGNRNLAWQSSPPPLYQEGLKVQTPWLYQFLLEPEQLRYTTVLRMPRFNLSPEEAQVLANYFAAVDDAEFPYQEQKPTEREYLAAREAELVEEGVLSPEDDYLKQAWMGLNGDLCIKCHSLGGRKFKVSDPKKDIQGPNLNRVQKRLRADWVKLWLYKPTWIIPYTSMPVNFPHNAQQWPDILNGNPDAHVIGMRDALMNYSQLMEDIGPTVYVPPKKDEQNTDAAGGEE